MSYWVGRVFDIGRKLKKPAILVKVFSRADLNCISKSVKKTSQSPDRSGIGQQVYAIFLVKISIKFKMKQLNFH